MIAKNALNFTCCLKIGHFTAFLIVSQPVSCSCCGLQQPQLSVIIKKLVCHCLNVVQHLAAKSI